MCWGLVAGDFARVAMLPFLPLGSTGTGTMPSSRTHGSLIWPWIAIAWCRSICRTTIETLTLDPVSSDSMVISSAGDPLRNDGYQIDDCVRRPARRLD
jgi:hypothetical protein